MPGVSRRVRLNLKNRDLPRTTAGDETKFIDEIRAKQRNIVWPDTLVNSRAVDVLLWKGSRDATTVQRIVMVLYGLVFLICGLVFSSLAKGERSLILMIFSFGLLLLAVKLMRNAFRNRGGGPGSK